MTEKELKDWCKTCNVEPPAMKFKCPECEHNPDKEQIKDSLKNHSQNFSENSTQEKEQIMINGVDVSGCRNFDKESYKLDVYDCDLNELHGYCSCNNDCCFKQHARKTQECEQIKEKYEALKLENQEGYEIVAELKHECEELKKKLRELELKNTTLQNRYQQLDGATIELDRHRKALETIEGMLQAIVETNRVYPLQSNLYKILDIISRAKGEE